MGDSGEDWLLPVTESLQEKAMAAAIVAGATAASCCHGVLLIALVVFSDYFFT